MSMPNFNPLISFSSDLDDLAASDLADLWTAADVF